MNTQITCPKCRAKIDVGLQLQKTFRVEYEKKLKQEIDKKLSKERKNLQLEIKQELHEESLEEINNLKYQLKESRKKFKDQEIKKDMKIIELEKRQMDQKKLIDEMQRKQNSISQKMQGEVGEIAIEQFLQKNFPSDIVLPTKNGEKGADCLQEVRQDGVQCGKIYFECKRAKNFKNEWIVKLKIDQKHSKADIGVLVTEVLPKDMSMFGIKEGIIICTFDEFKGVTYLLRNQLILLNASKSPQINRDSKIEKLYQYLTGNEFKFQFEAIARSYKEMKQQLEREKSYMKKTWDAREKQIDIISSNAGEVYGSIKSISGLSQKDLPQLEFDDSDLF